MTNLTRVEFMKDLKEMSECRDLEHLLFQTFQPGKRTEEEVGRDFQELKSLTDEIKAINKQQIVLVGERLKKARDIFRNYGDGEQTFTKWLDQLFTSRRTAYNVLNYYEFYMELPTIELKSELKKMPLKVAYCLSSRQAPLEQKVDIIKSYAGEKPEDTLLVIKERFPVDEKDKRRKDPNKLLLKKLDQMLQTVQRRKQYFSQEVVQELLQVKNRMRLVLEEL
jgi:hypothetical protein